MSGRDLLLALKGTLKKERISLYRNEKKDTYISIIQATSTTKPNNKEYLTSAALPFPARASGQQNHYQS